MSKKNNNKEEELGLRQRVKSLEEDVDSLKNDLKVSLNVIAELLGEDGTISVTLKSLEKELAQLNSDVSTTNDALGDSKTLRSLISSLSEIKSKLGIR